MRTTLPFATVGRLAFLGLGRNKGRSAFALAVIATGVAALILTGGFVRDLIFQLGEAVIHSQSGHVQMARAGYFELGTRSPGKYLVSSQDLERANVASIPHVRDAMRRISFSGLLSNGRSTYPVIGEGIEPEREGRLGTYMVLRAGRLLSSRDSYGALVGEGVARAMNLKPGSAISVVAPTVDEAMNTVDLEVVGIFQSFSKDYDDRVIKLPLQTAQNLLDTAGVNLLVLVLDETANTSLVARMLTDRAKNQGLEVKTWDWLNDFYWKTVALYDRQFGVLRLIVLVMVMFAVAGIINMALVERVGEFGTMRAVGNTGWDVIRLCVMEAAVMGVLGALLGVVLGMGLGWLISRLGIPMPPPPNSNLEFTGGVRIVPSVVAGAFAIGVLATLIASLPASVRVSRMPIAEALRRVA
jgi:putative ABC transport system permease protein